MHAPGILLVDDYADAREMYETYLTSQGYGVATASTGAAAIELARAMRPALILLDVPLPDMPGTEVVATLRRELPGGVSIVAFTARVTDEELDAAQAAGFDALITKPCAPDALAAEIDSLLSTATLAGFHDAGRHLRARLDAAAPHEAGSDQTWADAITTLRCAGRLLRAVLNEGTACEADTPAIDPTPSPTPWSQT